MKNNKTALKLNNITKIFNNNEKINNNINLEIKYGEIHALFGENGAGKTTLVKIISGEHQKTSGTIEINGKLIPFYNTLIAKSLKVGIVNQHFSLIEDFTVYENIVLGNEFNTNEKINEVKKLSKEKKQKFSKKFNKKEIFNSIKKNVKKIISWLYFDKKNYKNLERLIKKYNLKIDLNKKVKDISISEQQKTEIMRLLSKKSEIIIFDEPTSVLTLEEIEIFLKTLEEYKKDGKAILFITHKVEEIKKIADKVSIIRNGKLIGCYDVDKISIDQMVSKMVEGEKIIDLKKFKRNKVTSEKILEVKNLFLFSSNKKESLHNIKFKINKGEIVGIAGIENNGQKKLLEVIAGIEKRIKCEIKYDGETNLFSDNFKQQKTPWIKYNVETLRKHGISYIPRDRLNESLLKNESLYLNYCFNSFQDEDFFSGFLNFIEKEKIKTMTKNMCIKYNVKGVKDLEQKIGLLSGGNQQKFVIGRELTNKPKLLLINQPTWGIDKKSIGFVYEKFIKLRNKGNSILFASTDLKEILTLSDRVLVMSKGRILGEVYSDSNNAINQISKLITKKI